MDDNPANAGGPIPRRNVPSPPFERYERPRDTPPKPSMRPDDDGVPSRTRVPVIDAPESPEPKDGPPKLRRGIIFDDGAVKCVFSDRSSMVLDPTGECFTAHDSWSGETTRQLSEFAISRFAPRLRAALEFRNTHVDVPFCPPCVSKPAASDVPPRSFRVGRKISLARWSKSAEDAEAGGFLTRLEGGGAVLESIDGIARVVLSAHGLMAHVTYPVMFATREPEDGDKKCDFLWQTQNFCARVAPERWSYPIDLLTAVVNDDGNGGTETEATLNPNPKTGTVTVLPASSTAVTDDEPKRRVWVNEGDEAWWAEADLAGFPGTIGRAPVVELSEGTVMWAVKAADTRGGGVPWRTGRRMEALAGLEDGTALATTDGGSFVLHVADERGGAATPAMYKSDVVPATVAGAGGYRSKVFQASGLPVPEGVDVAEGKDEFGRFLPLTVVGKIPIGKVAPRLVAFRKAAELLEREPEPIGDVWGVQSVEVVAASTGDGTGRYTAYADGRVRIAFFDRTLLDLSRDGSMCRMLLPDATKVEVHVDEPGKHAEHVVAALEFADWAYRTPEEREAAAAHEQAMVDSIQAEIDANRRMVSIISGKPGKDCYNDEELCELAMKAAKSGMATEFNNRGPMLEAARAVLKGVNGLNGDPIEIPDVVRISLSDDTPVAQEAQSDKAEASPAPPMSVEEMLARNSRWLEEVKHVGVRDDKEKKSPSSVLDSAADYPDMTDKKWSERTRKRLELVMNSIDANDKWLTKSLELRKSWHEIEFGVKIPPVTDDEVEQSAAQEETTEEAAPAPEVESEAEPAAPEVESEAEPAAPEVESEAEPAAPEVEAEKMEEPVGADVEEENEEASDKKQKKKKKKKGK